MMDVQKIIVKFTKAERERRTYQNNRDGLWNHVCSITLSEIFVRIMSRQY